MCYYLLKIPHNSTLKKEKRENKILSIVRSLVAVLCGFLPEDIGRETLISSVVSLSSFPGWPVSMSAQQCKCESRAEVGNLSPVKCNFLSLFRTISIDDQTLTMKGYISHRWWVVCPCHASKQSTTGSQSHDGHELWFVTFHKWQCHCKYVKQHFSFCVNNICIVRLIFWSDHKKRHYYSSLKHMVLFPGEFQGIWSWQ